MSNYEQGSPDSKLITEQCEASNMVWAKARQRGKSGYGEEINKKLNMLLHLLVLLHPRGFRQEKKEGVTYRTSMERKLRDCHRESKSSLVSSSIVSVTRRSRSDESHLLSN